MTMMSSFGGGTTSLLYSLIKLNGKIDTIDIINGILGSLVGVTAGCFLYQGLYFVAILYCVVTKLVECVHRRIPCDIFLFSSI